MVGEVSKDKADPKDRPDMEGATMATATTTTTITTMSFLLSSNNLVNLFHPRIVEMSQNKNVPQTCIKIVKIFQDNFVEVFPDKFV